ncbi:MAG: trypsin-like peptidase domain-containing protein [Lachnospiraceae bacterium]|nr:trypsin-like peptidase domain-containing protein [Lachnospiraceae bacterium]
MRDDFFETFDDDLNSAVSEKTAADVKNIYDSSADKAYEDTGDTYRRSTVKGDPGDIEMDDAAGETTARIYERTVPDLPREFDEYEEEDYGGRKTAPAKDKTEKKKSGFSRLLAKCAALAVVFGLVAGLVFQGVNAVAGGNRGGDTAQNTVESGTAQQKVEESTGTAVPVVTMQESTLEALVEEAMPSIVAVNVVVRSTTQDFLGRTYSGESKGAGSGIIIGEEDGRLYILTNHHVIKNAKQVSVTFADDTAVDAYIAGYKEDEDIAVIVVDMLDVTDETRKAIKTAAIGDSDTIKPGATAVAIGNALGYGQSVTLGIISAVDREVKMTDGSMTLIQTDAAINPGNSGGALLNSRGEVIGVNSAKYSDTSVEGMGFAIPINKAMEIARKIIDNEDDAAYTRDGEAYLGIYGGTITAEMAERYDCPRGVYVSSIIENSAAMAAGIESGYIITEFDGHEILTMEELTEEIAKCRPGDMVEVKVYVPDYYGNYSESTVMKVKMGAKDEDAYANAKEYEDTEDQEETEDTKDRENGPFDGWRE